jgi:hypothetical protein
MNTNLRWKKSFLSNTYSIYSNGHLIGKLVEKTFSKSGNGILNGEKFSFNTSGFFIQHTDIIDVKVNKVIGEITYSNWMTKATVVTFNNKANWKYDNPWNTKWSISNSSGIQIKYAGSSANGRIDSNTDDSLLLLCGLFVTNYYRQMSIAVMVAIFIPIWASIANK